MKWISSILILLTLVGCHRKHDNSPPKVTLAEPIVVVSVKDEIGRPIPTACAIPDICWSGPPYLADQTGLIRLTAIEGKDILVFAPRFEDERISSSVWQTNRFSSVIMRGKREQKQNTLEPTNPPYSEPAAQSPHG